MKVAFISREGFPGKDGTWKPSGTGWHRCVLPARALRLGGIEAEMFHAFAQHNHTGEVYPVVRHPDGTLQALNTGWDVIVFCRWMQGQGGTHGGQDDIATVTLKAQAWGQRIVQDLDDWLWGVPTTNRGFYGLHPKLSPDSNTQHYGKGMAVADLITVSTEPLARRLEEKFRRPTVVVRNMLDLSEWTRNEVKAVPEAVGWTGSTAFRGGDLETLRGILGPFLKRHGLRFIHGGAAAGTQSAASQLFGDIEEQRRLGLEDVVENRPAVEPDEYPTLFRDMDIFVAPLSDRPFNECKSACKIMEASAAGVPYVASFVGPYQTYPGGGATAKRPKHWLRELERLMDYDERVTQRELQYAQVRREDISVRWRDWAAALIP